MTKLLQLFKEQRPPWIRYVPSSLEHWKSDVPIAAGHRLFCDGRKFVVSSVPAGKCQDTALKNLTAISSSTLSGTQTLPPSDTEQLLHWKMAVLWVVTVSEVHAAGTGGPAIRLFCYMFPRTYGAKLKRNYTKKFPALTSNTNFPT